MLTIFTTAKPFVGQTRTSQLNGLRSWQALIPEVEIILFGRGEGYAQVARYLGLVHIENVDTSKQGTPLVDSMFGLAWMYGKYPVQMYVNCDIILIDGLIDVIRLVNLDRFLVVGQRWDLDLQYEICFDLEWKTRLHAQVAHMAVLHPPAGSDYFLYKGDIWRGIPKLVIGRAGYDNELLYHCRASQVPVIDASQVLTVVHQNHDYGHHPQGVQGVWQGAEAQLNLEPARKRDLQFTLLDADWRLASEGLRRNYARGDWVRYFQHEAMLRRGTRLGYMLERFFWLSMLIRRIQCRFRRLTAGEQR